MVRGGGRVVVEFGAGEKILCLQPIFSGLKFKMHLNPMLFQSKKTGQKSFAIQAYWRLSHFKRHKIPVLVAIR
jgi:hypothetical protein